MSGGFSRLVRGLAWLATPYATSLALSQARAESPGAPDMLGAQSRSDDAPGPLSNEREFIAPPLPRPAACHTEMQAQIRVAGTVYDARHPERSLALIGAAGSPATGVYRTGSRYGQLELLEIRPHAVLLSSNREESPCWLKMMRPNPNAPPPPRAAESGGQPPAAGKKQRKKTFSREELVQNIQQIGPGVYSVNRSILERALASAPKLARTTRTKAVKQNGKRVGVSLARIESDGLFEHLGLKKGDVLKTVNGFDMSSIDGMLSARTQLSKAPRLSLALVRGGQPMTLEYRVK
jgi:type II secretory pathway component PulC